MAESLQNRLARVRSQAYKPNFTMQPNYEGTIPPEQSLTKYVPSKEIVPIESSARVVPKAEFAGDKNFYTSQGDNMAEFGKNVPGKGIPGVAPNKALQMIKGLGRVASGVGAAYGIYDMFKDVSIDPSGIIMTPERRRMIDNMNKPRTNILSDNTRNNIGGAIAQVFNPSAIDTEFQTQEAYPIKHPAGFESTVSGKVPTQAIIGTKSNTPAFSKDFNIGNLDLGLPQKNPMDFYIDNPFRTTPQNTEVQSPIIKADSSDPDVAHNNFMQRLLEQTTNNSVGIQEMNATNSATAYNNMLEAGIARGANSRSKGSYTPTYQKAVAYSPQAMNFGGNQQQVSNPYLGMFDPTSGTQFMTPRKDKQMPVGMDANSITQNGKSIWDAKGKLIPSKELTSQMQAWGDKPYQAPDTAATTIRDAWGNKNYQGIYRPMGGF